MSDEKYCVVIIAECINSSGIRVESEIPVMFSSELLYNEYKENRFNNLISSLNDYINKMCPGYYVNGTITVSHKLPEMSPGSPRLDLS